MLNLHKVYPHTNLNININDFYYLPEPYVNYAMNIYGEVINLISYHWISISIDSKGYPNIRVWSNNRSQLLRIHQLKALMFLPVPLFDKPVVNHKDGDKTNNSIDNLEWTTMRGNSLHAYATGLRNDNVPLNILDTITGKIITANSYHEAGRLLNKSFKGIHGYVNYPDKYNHPYLGRWEITKQ